MVDKEYRNLFSLNTFKWINDTTSKEGNIKVIICN